MQGRRQVKAAAKQASPGLIMTPSSSHKVETSPSSVDFDFLSKLLRNFSSSASMRAAPPPPLSSVLTLILSSLIAFQIEVAKYSILLSVPDEPSVVWVISACEIFSLIRARAAAPVLPTHSSRSSSALGAVCDWNFIVALFCPIFSSASFCRRRSSSVSHPPDPPSLSCPYPFNSDTLTSAIFIAATSFTPSPHMSTFFLPPCRRASITRCFVCGEAPATTANPGN
mmetsp:Transcript_6948/g.12485  ORF Transcript_6948/g.12485 Transcript_6948/m.12485 type:complete len:226 (-) Transcript_6948:779-1456(-)